MGQLPRDISPAEFMIICGSRTLTGAHSVLVGIGQPNMAALMAKRLHAPDLVLLYESGVIDAAPDKLPLSIGDPTLVDGAAGVVSMLDLFELFIASSSIEVGFVGGAQIDRVGRINATVIGEYDSPEARLPGSGGASDIALGVRKLVVMTKHEPRRLVREVDFITAAIPTGVEEVVVTDLAVLELRGDELQVVSIHPGVTPDDVRRATSWDIEVPSDTPLTEVATREEFEALEQLDPEGLYAPASS